VAPAFAGVGGHPALARFQPMECVKARKKPVTSEQVGSRSAICCHLLNQVYYHGQKIKWDPAEFTFVGGTGDSKWLTRDYRKPWSV
jgi:hypothetical protein